MIGKMVELHLLCGKRFLGKVSSKDTEGIILYCIPVKALESVAPGAAAFGEIREMLHTIFFPWSQVQYIDIGGEPMGFDHLYGSWFNGVKIEDFFDRITDPSKALLPENDYI